MMYRKFGEKGTGCSTVAEKSSGSRIMLLRILSCFL